MNAVHSIWEKFREIKPAGKAAVVVIVLLAQCCICILPFYALNAASAEAGRLPGGDTYFVGPDIQPGLYAVQASSGANACAWARLADTGAVIAADRAAGDAVIRVARGDFALRTDCAVARLAD